MNIPAGMNDSSTNASLAGGAGSVTYGDEWKERIKSVKD